MKKIIETPLKREEITSLRAGDTVYITGYIYTARDAAHIKMNHQLNKQEKLPFELKNNIIYYLGPSPAREGKVIGSAGPTTSGRMDPYTPRLLDLGLRGTIGKGIRDEAVIESIKKNESIYFVTVGGAGALLSRHIKKSEVIAYEHLGTEAIRKLFIEELPVIVAIDTQGNNLYELARNTYKK